MKVKSEGKKFMSEKKYNLSAFIWSGCLGYLSLKTFYWSTLKNMSFIWLVYSFVALRACLESK